ncbi:hypothetical protein ANO11243_025700 [Dothideomycetidae sp. 11243]|nr:hypothetical protein ANO11243_025700 [fungal sp. No.11243]
MGLCLTEARGTKSLPARIRSLHRRSNVGLRKAFACGRGNSSGTITTDNARPVSKSSVLSLGQLTAWNRISMSSLEEPSTSQVLYQVHSVPEEVYCRSSFESTRSSSLSTNASIVNTYSSLPESGSQGFSEHTPDLIPAMKTFAATADEPLPGEQLPDYVDRVFKLDACQPVSNRLVNGELSTPVSPVDGQALVCGALPPVHDQGVISTSAKEHSAVRPKSVHNGLSTLSSSASGGDGFHQDAAVESEDSEDDWLQQEQDVFREAAATRNRDGAEMYCTAGATEVRTARIKIMDFAKARAAVIRARSEKPEECSYWSYLEETFAKAATHANNGVKSLETSQSIIDLQHDSLPYQPYSPSFDPFDSMSSSLVEFSLSSSDEDESAVVMLSRASSQPDLHLPAPLKIASTPPRSKKQINDRNDIPKFDAKAGVLTRALTDASPSVPERIKMNASFPELPSPRQARRQASRESEPRPRIPLPSRVLTAKREDLTASPLPLLHRPVFLRRRAVQHPAYGPRLDPITEVNSRPGSRDATSVLGLKKRAAKPRMGLEGQGADRKVVPVGDAAAAPKRLSKPPVAVRQSGGEKKVVVVDIVRPSSQIR